LIFIQQLDLFYWTMSEITTLYFIYKRFLSTLTVPTTNDNIL